MTLDTAHLAIYDTMADWEVGHLMVELRTGRFTGRPWTVRTVAPSADPITTMGGLRILPDDTLDDLSPARSNLLVLPGAGFWGQDSTDTSATVIAVGRDFLDAGVPVAAICGATVGLAEAGLLDDRRHTSGGAEALASLPGYRGQDHYVDARAVTDRGLVTAGPQSPVQFAAETLRLLGLATEQTLDAYVRVFADGDGSGYPVLMQAAA